MKNVAVQGCEFGISVAGVEVESGEVTVTSEPSTNNNVILNDERKGVYAGPMNITVSNFADSSISQGTGTGIIEPSAQHYFIDQQPVVLEEDSGTVSLSGVNPQSGSPVSGYSVTVKIKDAGQSVVTAE